MQTPIRLFSWNVNGVRACAKKGFLDWLTSSGADIVLLQETKASPEQLPAALRQPTGFQAEWCAAEKKGYSGVATLSRIPCTVLRGIDDVRFDTEGRVLVAQYPAFTLFNVYFPSGSSGAVRIAYKLAFYQQFLELLRPRLLAGEPIIIGGDVNTAFADIDLARPRQNRQTSGFLPEERAALGAYFDAGLIDSFRYVRPREQKYSWWSQVTNARERNIGWRLDYFLVSANLAPYIIDANIHPEIPGSDHCPVSLTLNIS